jgi:hypothetical protein
VLQGHLVFIQIVSHVIAGLSVDPGSAKQARTLALLLAHDLPAVHAVVHELMPRALTVADLPSRDQELRHVLDLSLLCFHFFSVIPTFHLLLLVLDLLLISSVGLHPL